MPENMNTGNASSATLPKEVSAEIWKDAQEESAVMRFANRITLPGVGISVPMVTGDPTASWVGETEEIEAGDSTLSSREIKGHKIGVIETFSKEFKRDLPGLYAELRTRLPKTIATKFDATIFHQLTGAPISSEFDTLADVQALGLVAATAYDDLVDIDVAVSDVNGALNAYVLSPKARGVLLRAKDSDERPLMVNNVQTDGAITSLLGVDAFRTGAVYSAAASGRAETLGFAGDFSDAFYGVVEEISIEVSDQASITKGSEVINLWQRDMFAVKVTAHLGFVARRKNRFVRITGAAALP